MLKLMPIPPAYITGRELERINASHTYFQDPLWKADAFTPYLKNENVKIWIASLYGRRIAFVIALESGDEIEIQFVATHRFFKNQGLAEAILKELEREAQVEGQASIFLEVRESNEPAQALYRKLGYEKIHRRKNYYKSPKEDAILMKRYIREKEDEN